MNPKLLLLILGAGAAYLYSKKASASIVTGDQAGPTPGILPYPAPWQTPGYMDDHPSEIPYTKPISLPAFPSRPSVCAPETDETCYGPAYTTKEIQQAGEPIPYNSNPWFATDVLS